MSTLSERWQRLCVPFLDAVRGLGVPAQLVDVDIQKSGDAVEHLRGLADGSAGAVSALDVAGHMPFEFLLALATEAMRVLAPGGLLLLKTQGRPLPPPLLSFIAESAGFQRIATLRLDDDCAIVAQKPGASCAALDELFAAGRGIDLHDMAGSWEQPLRQFVVDARLAREAATKVLFETRELAARLKEVERTTSTAPLLAEKAVDRMFQLEEQLRAMEGRFRAMQASTSWRVTQPLRWVGEKVKAIRREGVAAFMRSAPPAADLPVPVTPPVVLTAGAERVRDVMVHAARDEVPPGKDR
jgi:hypothetical protein